MIENPEDRDKTETFHIGSLRLKSPYILAPLAGVTDAPFRRLCFEMGAGYAVSEMVSAKGLYYGDKNTARLLTILPGEGPVGYQIFGHEPEIIAYAVGKLDEMANKVVDINMGCPVPKVVKNFEGSYLMKNPKLVEEIVRSAVNPSVNKALKPVTVKIRAGWDESSVNAVEVALAAEAGGAAAVAVHGRTREQYYSGKADWSVIADVRQALKIPVIGNGDVTDCDSCRRMKEETGVDLVMIGRAAQGNPWIFRELSGGERVTLDEKKSVMIRHLEDAIAFKGESTAVKEMRKHIGWYLKGERGSAKLRGLVNSINDAETLRRAIDDL